MTTLAVTLFTTGALGYGMRGCSTAWDCQAVGVYCYPGRRAGWPNHCHKGDGEGSLCDKDGDCFLSGNDRRMWCVDNKCTFGMQRRAQEPEDVEIEVEIEASEPEELEADERRRARYGDGPGCPWYEPQEGERCHHPTTCNYQRGCWAKCMLLDNGNVPNGPGVRIPMLWKVECTGYNPDRRLEAELEAPELEADESGKIEVHESVELRRQERERGDRRERGDDRWRPRCFYNWECGSEYMFCLHGACIERGLMGGRRLDDLSELEAPELA